MVASKKLAFNTRPDYLIADFMKHLAEVGEPNLWAYHCHEKPGKDGIDVLVNGFEIPDKKPRAPCPICSPNHPKYKKGHLLWSSVTGRLHAVGHCCGHKYFGDGNLTVALNFAAARTNRRDTESFLEANWKRPRSYNELLPTLFRAARSYDHVKKQLRSVLGRGGWRGIKQAASNGGFLQIEIEAGSNRYSNERGSLTSILSNFGNYPVLGLEMFATGQKATQLEARLKNAHRFISHINWKDENEALEWLIERSDSDLNLLADRLRDAEAALRDAKSEINALSRFLEETNLALINEWSKASLGNSWFGIFRKGNNEFACWKNGTKSQTIRLDQSLGFREFYIPKILKAKI